MKVKKSRIKSKNIIPNNLYICNFIGRFGVLLMLGLWLLFNITTSQLLSPLYFDLVNENSQASINYLRHIRLFPLFSGELEKYRQIYGTDIENYVFGSDRERQLAIQKYEQALQKNPQSVSALYNLFLLYSDNGNQEIAAKYLKLAKELDPTIK